MNIQTTANIDSDTERRITETAETLGVSVHRLAEILLKIILKKKPFPCRQFRAVKYQDIRPEGEWVCFHLRLPGAVYESSHDLRRLMKFSVSFLLCHAVTVYLEEAVRMAGEDNNQQNYTLSCTHTYKKLTFTAIHTFSDIPDPQPRINPRE